MKYKEIEEEQEDNLEEDSEQIEEDEEEYNEEELDDLEENVNQQNIIQENNNFFMNNGAEFVAPVLEDTGQIQEIPTLEETASAIPTTAAATDEDEQREIPYSGFSQYEENEREYELMRQEESRFDPTSGLVSDDFVIRREAISNPFGQQDIGTMQDRAMAQGNELEAFQIEQEKYRERLDEDTAPPFRRRGKKKRIGF